MEFGTIEREIHIDAAPEVVFDVVSKPEHVREWWPDEADFSGKGVAGGKASGVEGGKAPPVAENQTYFEFQVEKPVAQIPGTGAPRYPDALRSSGVEGEVQAQFVVDEDGKAEVNSFKVLKATNDLFANAVRTALPNMRFYPAEAGGRKVKQIVQMPFKFTVPK